MTAQRRCDKPDHELELASSCRICISEAKVARGADGPSLLTPPTPEQIDTYERGARLARAALARHTTTEGAP